MTSDQFRSPALSKRGISTSSLLSVENDLENEVKRDQVTKLYRFALKISYLYVQ